jgi:hypothetical protein
MMCVLYRHGSFLDNQVDPAVPLNTFPLAKPAAADFGHVIKIISTCTVMAVMLYTGKVTNIYRAQANNGNLLLPHSTNKCTYFNVYIFHLLWLLHVSAGRHPRGAGDQIPWTSHQQISPYDAMRLNVQTVLIFTLYTCSSKKYDLTQRYMILLGS